MRQEIIDLLTEFTGTSLLRLWIHLEHESLYYPFFERDEIFSQNVAHAPYMDEIRSNLLSHKRELKDLTYISDISSNTRRTTIEFSLHQGMIHKGLIQRSPLEFS
jgi:hypothetical protein